MTDLSRLLHDTLPADPATLDMAAVQARSHRLTVERRLTAVVGVGLALSLAAGVAVAVLPDRSTDRLDQAGSGPASASKDTGTALEDDLKRLLPTYVASDSTSLDPADSSGGLGADGRFRSGVAALGRLSADERSGVIRAVRHVLSPAPDASAVKRYASEQAGGAPSPAGEGTTRDGTYWVVYASADGRRTAAVAVSEDGRASTLLVNSSLDQTRLPVQEVKRVVLGLLGG